MSVVYVCMKKEPAVGLNLSRQRPRRWVVAFRTTDQAEAEAWKAAPEAGESRSIRQEMVA